MNNGKQRGFTLIELMLSMSFISVLLLAIAMTIIQIGTIYNRGMTLKEVNQTARSMENELRRSITSSQAFDLATNYAASPTQQNGRLCLGESTYLWNTARGQADETNRIRVTGDTARQLRFVKIADPSAIYCARNVTTGALLYRDIRAVDRDKVVELLKSGDRTLSLHGFKVTSGANAKDVATGQQLYGITYTIGTGDILALTFTGDQATCKPPGEPNSDFSYCSVQQFNLVLRAGNRVN